MNETIREYWESRAEQSAGEPRATTNDVYLRELEVTTLAEALQQIGVPEDGSVLDVGCGDGYSTLAVAGASAGLRFTGIDYSENMVATARRRLSGQPGLRDRVGFKVGDVLELGRACQDERYDVVITDRCLINLDSSDSQSRAIAQIAGHTKPGGSYLAIENFIETHDNMNEARLKMELPEIPVRWHNLFFKEAEFVESLAPFFEEIEFRDFSSSYYFATRVVYSAMCKMRGEEPDYRHEVHQLAGKLPWVGQFSPIRLAVSRRKA